MPTGTIQKTKILRYIVANDDVATTLPVVAS